MHATAKVLCSNGFNKYSRNTHFDLKWKSLLVLDNPSTHNTINVKEKLKECESAIWMIPSGQTWKLQPLDISINKVLKQNLRNEYVKYCMEISNLKLLEHYHRMGGWNMTFRLYHYQSNYFKFI